MKRLLTAFLIMLTAATILSAQTEDPSFKLFATKVNLSGEVMLIWTKPAGVPANTTYELYRAKVSDSTSFTLIKTTNDTTYKDKVPTIITSLSNSYAYYVLAKYDATVLKSNTIVLPVPGIPLIGSFRLVGNVDSGKVKLVWDKPPVDNVSYYLVYRGILGDAIPVHVQIDSTTNQWSISDAPLVFNPDSPVTFVFYVKAKLQSGETLVSTTLQLTIGTKPNRDELKFVSIPLKYGEINNKYVYTAKAISDDSNAVIRYFGKATLGALTVETGFKIDSATGVVDWTPQLKGWYYIWLYAKSNKGGYAKQEFAVSVAGGNGIVQGKVTNTLGSNVPNALIELFKVENNASISFAYSALTNMNGNYRIERIDPGSYKLRASVPGKYQSQWYDGVRNVDSATIIPVKDSIETFANIKLVGSSATQPKVTITGSVTDTFGIPILGSNCRVVFVRAEFALNLGAGLHTFGENIRKYLELAPRGDYRLEGNSEFVFKAKPDSLGNYKLELPPGAYIAFARATGYETEFFYEQSNILSATLIPIPLPPTFAAVSIDFTLAPLPPVVLGEITGAVIDSVKDIFIPARVLAFRDGWRFKDNHRISRVYIADTDSTGHYSFTDLLPGTYVVMAIPLGDYAPAFYSNDTMNVRWKRASKIVVNGNSIDNINIYVHQFGQHANGYTGITGNVTVNGGNGMMQGAAKAGAIVYAYNGKEVAGYGFTNASGEYAISGLAPGSYSVFVDKAGYNESAVVNVNAGYSVSGSPLSGKADFTINATTNVTADNSVLPKQYMLDQNYPNPFNPSTTISYALPHAGNVTLKVYDLLGKEVITLVSGYQQSGKYAVTFNASQLSSGIYFYRLESGKYSTVKKMMLLK